MSFDYTLEDYEEFKLNNTSPLEMVGNFVTSSDDILDYIAEMIIALGGVVNSMSSSTTSTTEEYPTTQINLSTTIESGAGIKLGETVSTTSKITEALIYFPDGCNSLVGVALWVGSTQICPDEDYICLNDTAQVFVINKEIEAASRIWADVKNEDDSNSHTISIIITVENRG